MKTPVKKAVIDRCIRKLGLVAILLVTSAGLAAARDNYPQRARIPAASSYKALADPPPSFEMKYFDDSGTLGRMNRGADPRHPEGPGNVSN